MHFVFEFASKELQLNFVSCEDYNKSGIRRFTPCPVAYTAMRLPCMESESYREFSNNITYSTTIPETGNYIIPSGVSHSPIDWCGPDIKGNGYNKSDPSKKTLFSFINPSYLKDLQSGRAFLLLDQSHEGYHEDWLWPWFHNNCEHYNINPRQVIYLTGNLDCKAQYDKWADENSVIDRIRPIPYPHFELVIWESAKNQASALTALLGKPSKIPSFDDHVMYKTKNVESIKTFNALQKRNRAHRIWFFKFMKDEGLLTDNIVSMNKFEFDKTYYAGRWMDIEDFKELDKLTPISPIEHPGTHGLAEFADSNGGSYVNAINERTMLDSWLTVVSEASFAESTCFISEKAFKPIACHHPFIILGNQGSLSHLKNLGYKTFHPFIDETYDTLPTWERMEAIIKEIKRIDAMSAEDKVKWYLGLKEILIHNYSTLHKNSRIKIPPAMKEVENYVSITS
jgi:hypothetical protein